MSLEELRRRHEECGLKTDVCEFMGIGATVVCDKPTFCNRLIQRTSFRSLHVMRRSCELLHLPIPQGKRLSSTMVYAGHV